MILSEQLVGILLVVALAGVVLLAATVVFLAVRLRGLRRAYGSALDPTRREDLFQAVQRQADELGEVRTDLGIVHENTETLRDLIRGTVSRVGVVRYDAFEDMGGALSFSAALLDERGDGVVISAINGRTETRTYAKALTAGESEHHLSDEEQVAIRQAIKGERNERIVTSGRRRRRASA